MYSRTQDSLFRLIFQIFIWGLLLWQSFYFFRTPIRELGEANFFLHGPNLIFHEAGHVIFGLAGNDLLTAFGGTLMQCLVPLLLAIAFAWKNKDAFATCCMLWWFGQNFVDVAPYINDARSLNLVLIGGHTGKEVEGHDWEFILERLGWIYRDIYIARDVLFAGRVIMLLALLVGALCILGGFYRRYAAGPGRDRV